MIPLDISFDHFLFLEIFHVSLAKDREKFMKGAQKNSPGVCTVCLGRDETERLEGDSDSLEARRNE